MLKPSRRGKLEIADMNNGMLMKGSLYKIIKDFWNNIGTFDSHLRIVTLLQKYRSAQ